MENKKENMVKVFKVDVSGRREYCWKTKESEVEEELVMLNNRYADKPFWFVSTKEKYELKIFSGIFEIDEPIYNIVSSDIEKIKKIAINSLAGTLSGNLAQLWHDGKLISSGRLSAEFVAGI